MQIMAPVGGAGIWKWPLVLLPVQISLLRTIPFASIPHIAGLARGVPGWVSGKFGRQLFCAQVVQRN